MFSVFIHSPTFSSSFSAVNFFKLTQFQPTRNRQIPINKMNIKPKMIIKIVEAILIFVLIILDNTSSFEYHGGVGSFYRLAFGVSVGYLIILAGMFYGMFKGQELPNPLDMFYMIVGAVIYILIAIIAFFSLAYLTGIMILDIIIGILFIVDAVMSYRG